MIQRQFILGSEWVFCKIYTGEKNADTILSKDILSINNILFQKKAIDKCFFIRYTDVSFHIRLRYHVTSDEYIVAIINLLCAKFNPFIQNRRIHKITYDTYIREIERYGANTYKQTEDIFSIDSQSIINILNIIYPLSDKYGLRWKTALLLIDDTLDAAEYTLELKKEFCEKRRDAYRHEFGITRIETIRQFNNKFRANRISIVHTMHREMPEAILQVLNERKTHMIQIFKLIKKELDIDIDDYLSSITHMTINRLFITKNRFCELVIFDYLYRYYDSSIAQLKYKIM